MNREVIRPILEKAVAETHKSFPDFLGVVVFGSFVSNKPEPNDLDVIPVMKEYQGNWDFSSVCEDDSPDQDPDYCQWKEVEKVFLSYFPLLTNQKPNLRFGRERGVHYESLVVLNNPDFLREELQRYHAKPENFVGDEEIRSILIKICRD